MSLSTSQRARLGAFMVGGCALLALLIAIPIGFKLRDRTNVYHARFGGESLSGLEQGALVKFHGIPVGKVEKLSYDRANLDTVRVTLRIKDEFPLKQDMVAQTGMMGITGLMYVEIMGGTNQAPLLKPGSDIPTRRSMISTITGKAEAIIGKVELLLNHLNEISNPDSLRSVKEILDNVAVISQDMRSFVATVRPSVEVMAHAAQRVLANADSISRDVSVLTADLRAGVERGQLSSILTAVDSTARSLSALSSTLDLTVKQSREDVATALQNIAEASENANELTKILAENPSLLLRGEQQKERDAR